MKISKSLIGHEVKLTWKDPAGGRIDMDKAQKGREALATWVEYGMIDDVTDGVVRFIQSKGYSSGRPDPDEGMFGWVPEELIEKCELLTVEKEIE